MVKSAIHNFVPAFPLVSNTPQQATHRNTIGILLEYHYKNGTKLLIRLHELGSAITQDILRMSEWVNGPVQEITESKIDKEDVNGNAS